MTTHEEESRLLEQGQENYIATNPDRYKEEKKRRIITVAETIKTKTEIRYAFNNF